MSWTPISNTVPQYEENGVAASGFYIKFYQSGTTTPTAMAIDNTGATTLDKCELNTEGYPINGSGAVFIPHIDQKYKILLYRNETDADNNTFSNKVWEVDLLIPVVSGQVGTGPTQIPLNSYINDKFALSSLLADAVANTLAVNGQQIIIRDRAYAKFEYKTGQTANTYNIVQCTGDATLSLVLLDLNNVSLPKLGALGVDDDALFQAGLDTGAKILDIGNIGALALSATRVVPAGVTITTSGATATVSGNTTILNLSQGSKVKGISWTGTGKTSGNTLELPVRVSGVGLCEVTGNTFTSIGGAATLVRQYYTTHDGSRIVNNTYTLCHEAINLDERGEYCTVSENTINNNTTGVIAKGGNNRIVNNTITDNDLGLLVDAGENDAHGNVDSNSINHNIINIQVNAINVEEMSFDGNSVYVGKIVLNGCKGVTFTGGLIESSVLIEEKGAEECEFRNVKFPGGINNTQNDGAPSKVLYKDCILDRSESSSTASSINGAYSEVKRVGSTTLATASSTTSIYNNQVFNAITANTTFTVEQLYSVGTYIWSPEAAIVERGFTVGVSAQLSVARVGATVDIANVYCQIVDAVNNNLIYGNMTPSQETVLTGDVRTHTFTFCGEIPRSNFQIRLVNESADTITILAEQADAKSTAIVTGW
jgi:hypothetical protein